MVARLKKSPNLFQHGYNNLSASSVSHRSLDEANHNDKTSLDVVHTFEGIMIYARLRAKGLINHLLVRWHSLLNCIAEMAIQGLIVHDNNGWLLTLCCFAVITYRLSLSAVTLRCWTMTDCLCLLAVEVDPAPQLSANTAISNSNTISLVSTSTTRSSSDLEIPIPFENVID
jgi:hypothetical protein